jgi:competence protein ComEA
MADPEPPGPAAAPTAPDLSSRPADVASPAVVVHVAGPVRHPGVVRLPAGARVVDALEAVGGLKPGAMLGAVNLARPVVDGERIQMGPGGGPPAGQAPGVDGGGPVGSPAPAGPLDLNAATPAQLEELPGVGPVLAGRIVAWRTEHGRFTAVTELLEVSGIGAATFAELEPLVRV